MTVITTQMMIRKPVEAVFQAFTDPEITTKFWFTHSSGKLETGKTITWRWEMYGVKQDVRVVEIIPDKKISIEWDTPVTSVEWEFQSLGKDSTYVIIRNYGFQQTGEELIQAVINNTGGFTTVLDAAKAYLEFGIELNLVRDKFPHAHQK